jgi:hypothetical protein
MHWMAHGECELPSTDDWLSERESTQLAATSSRSGAASNLACRWTAKRAVATVLAGVGGTT